MKKLFILLGMMLLAFTLFAQVQGVENESWAPANLVEVMSPNGKYYKFVQNLSMEEFEVLKEGQEVTRKYLRYIEDIELYNENKQINFNNANLMFEYLDTIKNFYDRTKIFYPNSGKALGAWMITQIVSTEDISYLAPLYLMFTVAGDRFMELGETERALAFAQMTKNIQNDYDAISAN